MKINKEKLATLTPLHDSLIKECYSKIYDVIDEYDGLLTNAALIGVVYHILHRLNIELDRTH